VYAPLRTSTWTTADATQLKKNTSFAVKQNRHKPIEEFQANMYNVLKHHFNRHGNCGEWCPTKKWKNNPAMLAKLCYRDKGQDMTTNLQLRKIRDPFFTLKKLEELRHPHDTHKCENVMKVITKFHPKDI
jgi:hypothetical protein